MANFSHLHGHSWELQTSPLRPLRAAGLGLLFLLGFAVTLLVELARKLETVGLQFITNKGLPEAFAILTVGLLIGGLLIRHADIALALFFLVGLVKGDPGLAS